MEASHFKLKKSGDRQVDRHPDRVSVLESERGMTSWQTGSQTGSQAGAPISPDFLPFSLKACRLWMDICQHKNRSNREPSAAIEQKLSVWVRHFCEGGSKQAATAFDRMMACMVKGARSNLTVAQGGCDRLTITEEGMMKALYSLQEGRRDHASVALFPMLEVAYMLHCLDLMQDYCRFMKDRG